MKAFYQQKTPQLNVNINQYWVVESDDYHEFDPSVSSYEKLGLKVNYEEVGFDGRWYLAVFWIGERPDQYISKMREIIN